MKKAEYRYLKGNPPRKKKDRNDYYGDAINWELILREANKKDELSIISFDSDYSEELYGKTKINNLLHLDWKKISRKKIKLFLTIGEFINDYQGKEVINKKIIDIEKENIKEAEFVEKSKRLEQLRDYVKAVVSRLSPREQKIIEMRFGLIDGVSHSLEDVALEFGVSREEIRKIEYKSLEKIQKFSM